MGGLSGYFWFSGRLGLAQFLRAWLRLSILSILVVAATFMTIHGFTIVGYLAASAIALILLSIYASCVRRLHDRGRSGWLAFVAVAMSFVATEIEKSSTPLVLLTLVLLALLQI